MIADERQAISAGVQTNPDSVCIFLASVSLPKLARLLASCPELLDFELLARARRTAPGRPRLRSCREFSAERSRDLRRLGEAVDHAIDSLLGMDPGGDQSSLPWKGRIGLFGHFSVSLHAPPSSGPPPSSLVPVPPFLGSAPDFAFSGSEQAFAAEPPYYTQVIKLNSSLSLLLHAGVFSPLLTADSSVFAAQLRASENPAHLVSAFLLYLCARLVPLPQFAALFRTFVVALGRFEAAQSSDFCAAFSESAQNLDHAAALRLLPVLQWVWQSADILRL